MSKMYPDISHFETVSDWEATKKNCPFLIHKATQRGEGNNPFVDPKLKSFITNCEERKIPYWLYCYLEKGNEVNQARFMVKTCRNLVGKYFVGYCLDAEEKNNSGNVIEALSYLKTVTNKIMLYTMYSQYEYLKKAINNRGTGVAWWEARYGLNNGKYSSLFKPHKGVELHQYTDKGKLSYISGELDLNRLTGVTEPSWFTSPACDNNDKKDQDSISYYTGLTPILPPRGYFKKGDGISSYINYKFEIKQVQKLINWIAGTNIEVDGQYGKKTEEAVKKAQKNLGVKVDGLFGKATLSAAMTVGISEK